MHTMQRHRLQHNRLHRLALAVAAGAMVWPTATQAAAYNAICTGGGNCNVVLGAGRISLPGLVIDKDQVLSWSQGGSGTKTDVGMGVGSVILFGLPGLIGFGAKKHDYIYTINYVDESGNTQVATVGFKNNVPANQFMMEMMGMTGLSIGEVNKGLQDRIDAIKSQAAEQARIAALSCAPVLKPFQCSYDSYLKANPAVQVWAARYPQLVPAEKARLRAAD